MLLLRVIERYESLQTHVELINDDLATGGLFNPELGEHKRCTMQWKLMTTQIYLELMIEWHRDILVTRCNNYDRKWKLVQ